MKINQLLFLITLFTSPILLASTIIVAPGSTTAQIQAAIDNVETAGGGIVTVQAGTYSLTSPLLVPGGVIFEGEGHSTILITGVSGRALIENKYAGLPSQDQWMIRDLYLIPSEEVSGIRSFGTGPTVRPNRLTIDNVQVANGERGYECNFSSNTKVINFSTSASKTGIYQEDCADNDYINISVQSGSDWGFVFRHVYAGTYNEGTRCVNCTTNGQQGGVHIDGADWVNISNSSFTTSRGIGAALIDNNAVNWSIDNSEFASTGDVTPLVNGIHVTAGSEGGNLSDSKFILNAFGAIISADNTRITGNVFANNYNVDLVSTGSNNIIHDNLVTSDATTNTSGFSLWIQSTASTNSVKGNMLQQVFLDQGINTNAGVLLQNICNGATC